MFNKIKEFFNSIKQPMAEIKNKTFVPVDKNDKEAVINFLMNYKKQNPVKFELKKEALFKEYGISFEEAPTLEPVKDETDIQLENLKEKVKKTK